MATPPTFSAGAVLTAAQMNAVGLWLVKADTIGSAVATVTVSSAFSADYDLYLITVSGGVASVNGAMRIQFGATTTGYYGSRIGTAYNSDTVIVSRDNNATLCNHAGVGTTDTLDAYMIVNNPYATKRTEITAFTRNPVTTGGAHTYNGFVDTATSYTAFTISPAAGTYTGGTVRVYGYRN